MIRSIDLELLPPLPDTLDEAHREIIYLKEQLYRARQNFAQQVVEREKDRRAAKGNIKAVAAENAELRATNSRYLAGLTESHFHIINEKTAQKTLEKVEAAIANAVRQK